MYLGLSLICVLFDEHCNAIPFICMSFVEKHCYSIHNSFSVHNIHSNRFTGLLRCLLLLPNDSSPCLKLTDVTSALVVPSIVAMSIIASWWLVGSIAGELTLTASQMFTWRRTGYSDLYHVKSATHYLSRANAITSLRMPASNHVLIAL